MVSVTNQPQEPEHASLGPLLSDEPIRRRGDDLLERSQLVDAIARQIRSLKTPDPIIVGFNAPWGAGKTSFLHLLEQRLKHHTRQRQSAGRHGRFNSSAQQTPGSDGQPAGPDDHSTGGAETNSPIIIHFNPWFYGTTEQLIRMFFADLAEAIRGLKNDGDNSDADIDKIIQLLDEFADQLAFAASTFAPFDPASATYLASAALVVKSPKLIQRARNLFSSQPSRRPDNASDKGRTPIATIRENISEELAKTQRRIVVFIDDIDRLEPDLTRLLFRMVRLNANFSYMTYVLAFDRSIVEQHLSVAEQYWTDGRDYLDKIIQVSYDIPQPHPKAIQRILLHELDDLRVSIGGPERKNRRHDVNGRRYDRIFTVEQFAEHFPTIRSIKRYVNALRLTLPPVLGQVDIVDFYVIELIRLSYPELYLRLIRDKEILVCRTENGDVRGKSGSRHDLNKRRQEWLDESLAESGASPEVQDLLKKLLHYLFPDLYVSDLGDGSTGTPPSEEERRKWRSERRVCSSETFDKFFLLTVPSEELTETEKWKLRSALEVDVDDADAPVADPERVRGWFKQARARGKIVVGLEELGMQATRLTAASAQVIAEVICSWDARDDLQLGDDHEGYALLSNIVDECRKRQAGANVTGFLTTLIEHEATYVFTVAKIFALLIARYEDGGLGHDLVSTLKATLIGKIDSAGEQETLSDEDRYSYLIDARSRLGDPDEGD